ncbi:MAG TPA: hypothetical protein VF192_07925 [Longimicrobiales bacterium]
MPRRVPEERTTRLPEDPEPAIDAYDAAPPDLPPAPAGAGVEAGGEPYASRRRAGRPADDLRQEARTALDPEPFLGYDGLGVDGVLAWIREADPDSDSLRVIRRYESAHRRRAPILHECTRRLRLLSGESGS